MTQPTRFHKGLRLLASFALLGAILACGGTDNSDDTPPPVVAPIPPPVAPPPVAPPAPVVMPTTLVQLNPGFLPDPHTMTSTAGGPTRADTLDQGCSGNIPATPQHSMTLQDDFRNLKIMVNSTGDTTLVIRDPAGTYRCNDDGTNEGLNPAIEGAFAAGTYQIFVGVYAGTPATYTIGFTEISSNMTTGLALP